MCFSSCSHTYVSQTFPYPAKSKPLHSEPAEFKVYIVSLGATGKAYVARSNKKVFVSLYKQNISRTKADYVLNSADLTYEVTWSAPGQPTLHFYDLPDGISSYDAGASDLRKEILTKSFRYDKASDRFLEQPKPKAQPGGRA